MSSLHFWFFWLNFQLNLLRLLRWHKVWKFDLGWNRCYWNKTLIKPWSKFFLRQMHKLYSNKCQIKFMRCFDQGGCTSPHNIIYVVQTGYPQNFDRQNPDRVIIPIDWLALIIVLTDFVGIMILSGFCLLGFWGGSRSKRQKEINFLKSMMESGRNFVN